MRNVAVWLVQFVWLFVHSHPHSLDGTRLSGWLVGWLCAPAGSALQKFTAYLRPLLKPQVGLISHYCVGDTQYGSKSLSCLVVKSTAPCKVASQLLNFMYATVIFIVAMFLAYIDESVRKLCVQSMQQLYIWSCYKASDLLSSHNSCHIFYSIFNLESGIWFF